MRDYRGKTVVITGAGSGIGRALALEFARRGTQLAVSDRSEASIADTVSQCRDLGADAVGYPVDVGDREAVYAHADAVATDFGGADVVINNAGVAVHGRASEVSDADFDWIMSINFWGVVHGSRAFLPQLIASGDGQLANVSSVFGLTATPKNSAYNASKFAVRGFTESLRQELRVDRTPLSVSCIHPGGVKTNIATTARIGASEDSAVVRRLFSHAAITSADRAARTIVAGLSRDRARILVGPDAWLIAALPRLFGAYYSHPVETAARLLHL